MDNLKKNFHLPHTKIWLQNILSMRRSHSNLLNIKQINIFFLQKHPFLDGE